MAANVVPGILTKGLSCNGTSAALILGSFNLGCFDFEITPPRHRGGTTLFKGLIPYREWYEVEDQFKDPEEEYYHKITFRIRFRDKTWTKEYYMKESLVNATISVNRVINNITNNISIKVTDIRQALKNLRIRRKQ